MSNETAEPPVERPPSPPRPLWLSAMVAIAGLIVLLNLAAFLYALSLPDRWGVTESVVVEAPVDEVRPLVATAGRWPDWSAFSTARDATLLTTTDGLEKGAGSILRWRGELFGTGELKITEVSEKAVAYEIVLHGQPFSEGGRLTLEPTDDGTEVTWSDGGPLEDTMSRLFGSVIENGIARDFAFGLGRLKEIAEDQPVESEAGDGPVADE